MRKLKTLNKTSNYKILSALPIMSVCLATTSQTSSAMFRSAFNSFSKFVQRSAQSTINPSNLEVKYIYRNGSRIAITHTGSLKNSNLNQTSGISTTTSPSPNSNLNVRPKTSTSSNLQAQSPDSYDDPSSMNPFSQLILQSISNGASATEVANTIVDMTFPIAKVNLMKNHYERLLLGKATSKIINNDNNSSLPHLLSNSIISKIQIKAMEKNPLFALN